MSVAISSKLYFNFYSAHQSKFINLSITIFLFNFFFFAFVETKLPIYTTTPLAAFLTSSQSSTASSLSLNHKFNAVAAVKSRSTYFVGKQKQKQ